MLIVEGGKRGFGRDVHGGEDAGDGNAAAADESDTADGADLHHSQMQHGSRRRQ